MSKCSSPVVDQQFVSSNSAVEWSELGCCIFPRHHWSGRGALRTSQTRCHEWLPCLAGQCGQLETGDSRCEPCTHSTNEGECRGCVYVNNGVTS